MTENRFKSLEELNSNIPNFIRDWGFDYYDQIFLFVAHELYHCGLEQIHTSDVIFDISLFHTDLARFSCSKDLRTKHEVRK